MCDCPVSPNSKPGWRHANTGCSIIQSCQEAVDIVAEFSVPVKGRSFS